jgi:uncharacterized protein (TIGR01244 family)
MFERGFQFMFRRLTDDYHVAPQIELSDVAAAAAEGFVLIVNNRPDGEDPDAPQGDAVAAAARDAGIAYVAVPVGHGGFSHAQLDALDAARAAHPGKTLAYCRSGTRSAHLWALASARGGADPDALCDAAAGAGYDLAMLRPMLTSLSAGS